MNAMNARQHLTEKGYVVLYKAVTDEMTNKFLDFARHEESNWSNGTWNGEALDTYRPRALLPDYVSRALTAAFRRHYRTFFPSSTATEWSLLKTHAGAPDQPVRRDFPPPLPDMNAANVQGVPGALLLATKDDTVIYGYGWNRLVALRSNVETIRLNKGDMLLFRGDFIYSPAGYLKNNLFVHGFLDSPFYPRDIGINEPLLVAVIDDLSIVDDLFCFVHNCDFVATGTMSLRRHLNRFHSFFFGRPRSPRA